jgi:DNA repair protein RecO (recombination protein O)
MNEVAGTLDAHIDDVDMALAAEAIGVVDVTPRPASNRRRAPRSETRIADEAAFVLHSYPYKETSLIVDALTRHHGRVALVARGAKRPRSALRGMLLAFQPLSISWVQSRARAVTGSQGGNDLRTLTRAEWLGGLRPLRGEALMSGFYLNELIQKLLARDDPHERLFDAYLATLAALSDDQSAAPVLRNFEIVLLREAGYAVHAEHAIDGKPIDPLLHYRYLPERGPMAVDRDAEGDADAIISGKTLLDIDRDDYTDPVTLAQSKRLMRYLLQHHLSGQLLQTRRMVLDLQSLEEGIAR